MTELHASTSASLELPNSKWERFSHYAPWLVLVICLAVTYGLWLTSKFDTESEAQDYFDIRVRESLDRAQYRLMVYEQVLRGAQGLFKATNYVSRDEFKNYVSMLRLADNFPGIQGVGFSQVIPPGEKERHLAALRKEGFPEYTIKPEGKRDFYTSIIYLEPFAERNLRAFGYDMYSEPVRRAAMERARDIGQAAMSGKVLLVQEAKLNTQAGFLMYLPVYRNNAPHDTLAQRRENLIGWVYSPFRTADLMHGVYGDRTLGLNIQIYDGTDISGQSLMYDSSSSFSDNAPTVPRFSASRQLEIAGQLWTMVISSRPSFELRINTNRPDLIAAGGIVISLLLTLMIWTLVNRRRRAILFAQRMNHDLIANEQALRESETKLQNILDSVAVAIAWANTHGEIKYANHKFYELFGYTLAEIPTVEEWYLRAYPDAAYRDSVVTKWNAEIATARQQGTSIPPIELAVTCKQGLTRHVILTSAWVGTDILASFSDITERKRAEKALHESKTILQAILDNLPYLVWMKDSAHRFIVVNKPFLAYAGKIRTEDVLGKTDADLWPGPLAEKFRRDDETVIALRKQLTLEEQVLDNGKLVWTETFKSPVLDEHNQLLGITGFARDITERKLDEIKVRHLAHHDTLTELPNRSLFFDRLQQTLVHARRNQEHLAVLFLDLDQFKPVNDTFGHDIGDLLLIEVAHRLLGCVRESDTVARIGGDEFCILLSSIESENDVCIVADKILHALHQPFDLQGNHIKIAASIGIALYPQDGKNEHTLIKNADIAMYFAKQAGRDNIKFYVRPDMRQVDVPHPVNAD